MKCFVYIFANTHPRHDNKILLLNLSHDNTKPSKYFLHNTENFFMTNTSTTQGNSHNFFQQHREFLHDNIDSTLKKIKKHFVPQQIVDKPTDNPTVLSSKQYLFMQLCFKKVIAKIFKCFLDLWHGIASCKSVYPVPYLKNLAMAINEYSLHT